MIFPAIVSAIILDTIFGEPTNYHPLVTFGKVARKIESHFKKEKLSRSADKWLVAKGLCAVILCVAPPVFAIQILTSIAELSLTVQIMSLYFAIGHKSLWEHALPVAESLKTDNLPQARYYLSRIVSRDTKDLDQGAVARAATESVLENGNDSIFGAIFWFLVAGAPGAIMYRLINTLDAMWGYRTEEYEYFGKAAAILDDIMNWIPARLTALSYSLAGNTATALNSWRSQGHTWYSPNAGPVMAAGAGALKVSLGGPAIYHGKTKERPVLGLSESEYGARVSANADHILCALHLVSNSLLIWLATILIMEVTIHAAPWRLVN